MREERTGVDLGCHLVEQQKDRPVEGASALAVYARQHAVGTAAGGHDEDLFGWAGAKGARCLEFERVKWTSKDAFESDSCPKLPERYQWQVARRSAAPAASMTSMAL